MKIIDLLNKIANGEDTPERIKYRGKIYTHNWLGGDNYFSEDTHSILEEDFVFEELNKEIEVLEEVDNKKIEKLKKEKIISGMLDNEIQYIEGYKLEDVGDKINEIIDYINKEEG